MRFFLSGILRVVSVMSGEVGKQPRFLAGEAGEIPSPSWEKVPPKAADRGTRSDKQLMAGLTLDDRPRTLAYPSSARFAGTFSHKGRRLSLAHRGVGRFLGRDESVDVDRPRQIEMVRGGVGRKG